MKITYDGVGDTLNILIKEEQIAYGEEHGPVIVNYNEKGKPVEVEILNASKFLGEFLSAILGKGWRKTIRNYRLKSKRFIVRAKHDIWLLVVLLFLEPAEEGGCNLVSRCENL